MWKAGGRGGRVPEKAGAGGRYPVKAEGRMGKRPMES
jgi:hypothetical protein